MVFYLIRVSASVIIQIYTNLISIANFTLASGSVAIDSIWVFPMQAQRPLIKAISFLFRNEHTYLSLIDRWKFLI